MKIGDTVKLSRDVATSLIGTRAEVIRISGLGTLTIQLTEDAKGYSCWKKGDYMNVMPYNVMKEERK